MHSINRFYFTLASVCLPLLALSGCSDNSDSAPTAKASNQSSNLLVISAKGEDAGNEDSPSCTFSFKAENRGKESLTPMFDFQPIHIKTGEVIPTGAISNVSDVIFQSTDPGKTSSNIMPKAVSGAACADIRLKLTKAMCMGSCTLEWKVEGFAGVEEQ